MISHQHRTVFVHIPKCGGQSVEIAARAGLAAPIPHNNRSAPCAGRADPPGHDSP